MEEENILQLIISSENLPIIINPDLKRWYFNSYSRGYHAYMNIWIPLIGDESLIVEKKKEMNMIIMLWLLLETTLLLNVCLKMYGIIFGNSYLCLRHQFALVS